jgi:hypothetical protein
MHNPEIIPYQAVSSNWVAEAVHSPPEITPRQVVCPDREWTSHPDLLVVPPGLRFVVANFMSKSGVLEGGLSAPLIGRCPRKVDRGG